jgi:hypothetical protein|tara:strand:+ start:339 stop:617 length:279 start_codon:yes stop_codon:yes gene_type:complete
MFVYRAIAFLILFLSVVLFPWWVFFILGVLGTFFFPKYYEFIFAAFFFDLLYGLPVLDAGVVEIFSHSLLFTILSIPTYILIEESKKSLRFY